MQINGWKIRELHKGRLQSFNGGMSWLWCNFFHLTDAVCFVAMYHLIISEFLQNALVGPDRSLLKIIQIMLFFTSQYFEVHANQWLKNSRIT